MLLCRTLCLELIIERNGQKAEQQLHPVAVATSTVSSTKGCSWLLVQGVVAEFCSIFIGFSLLTKLSAIFCCCC